MKSVWWLIVLPFGMIAMLASKNHPTIGAIGFCATTGVTLALLVSGWNSKFSSKSK